MVGKCKDIAVKITEVSPEDPAFFSKIKEAEILVADPIILQDLQSSLSNLKWAHSTFAGVDSLRLCSAPSYILTRQTGSFGQQMAEYVIAQIVNRERVFELRDEQKKHNWVISVPRRITPRHLSSLSVGLLGVGFIGTAVAKVCKALGMTVWGFSRTVSSNCPHVDYLRQGDGLAAILSNSDYVCNILPSTKETRGILDGGILKICQSKKPVFINVGRADVISESSLLMALKEGWLSGAILDVFEKEPLPENSELWKMPEVIITPHCAAITYAEEVAELFVTNLKLYLQGKELLQTVQWDSGY